MRQRCRQVARLTRSCHFLVFLHNFAANILKSGLESVWSDVIMHCTTQCSHSQTNCLVVPHCFLWIDHLNWVLQNMMETWSINMNFNHSICFLSHTCSHFALLCWIVNSQFTASCIPTELQDLYMGYITAWQLSRTGRNLFLYFLCSFNCSCPFPSVLG